MKDAESQATPARAACKTRGVRRRHVFFVPGYDPNVPRRYRELYRREARKQAAVSGYRIDVAAAEPAPGAYGWRAVAEIDGRATESLIEFLTWEDIVKRSMNRSLASTYLVLVRTVWIYLSTGALWRLLRLRPAPMIAALYPVVALLAQLALALAIGMAVNRLLATLLAQPLPALAGIAMLAAILSWFRRIDRHLYAHYLINDYGFTARHRGRWPEALEARIDAFAERMATVAADPEIDEVLVVGHSSGAHIAVSALAAALRNGLDAPRPALSLLTLGQVIPMLSFLPGARALRHDLNALSRDPRIFWVDVSAPGDGGCFALSDPVHVSGVAPPESEKLWPKVISAAFTKTMSPESLKRTRWRFFRRHVQYLCAFERPGDYDYFAITAGPRTLADRFGARGSTASRIETPLSGYRDT